MWDSRAQLSMGRRGRLPYILFWFPSSCLGTSLAAKTCFAPVMGFHPIWGLQAELGGQLRSQAGAWEPEMAAMGRFIRVE
jgi:hypothetical protein